MPWTPDPQPVSVLWDGDARRSERVRSVLVRLGARPLSHCDLSFIESVLADGRILLVGLSRPDHLSPGEIRLLDRARRGRLPVILYGDGVDRLPLSDKCAFLVAGARTLLDSGHDEFEQELRSRLRPLIDGLREDSEEVRRVRRVMGELGVVGHSAALRRVFRWLVRASGLSDLPVLITGETGSGKELAARAIHHLDPRRRTRPFVAVNCAAIASGIAESELFGHRRGAFTGAVGSRLGLFRAAHGGVVFLDEVGELGPDLQAKLLRVLQERRILAVGADEEVRVDVRVVAATNRDPNELSRDAGFRLDLYHRLAVLSVRIPSLTERPEDVPPLVQHFVERHRDPADPPPAVRPELIEALRAIRLPGNVRQLENVVRQMLVAKRDRSPLDVSDLPAQLWEELATPPEAVPDADRGRDSVADALLEKAVRHGWALNQCLDWCERMIVSRALERARGSRTETARLLGVTPRTVYNKIQKHRLDR